MSDHRLPADDPRLTAYVLDELDASERAELESELERSPETRAALAELRETIGLVSAALAGEPAPALSDVQRAAIAAAATSGNGQPAPAHPSAAGQRRFRGRYAAVAGISAVAALGLILAVTGLLGRSADQEGAAYWGDARARTQASASASEEPELAARQRDAYIGEKLADSAPVALNSTVAGRRPVANSPESQSLRDSYRTSAVDSLHALDGVEEFGASGPQTSQPGAYGLPGKPGQQSGQAGRSNSGWAYQAGGAEGKGLGQAADPADAARGAFGGGGGFVPQRPGSPPPGDPRLVRRRPAGQPAAPAPVGARTDGAQSVAAKTEGVRQLSTSATPPAAGGVQAPLTNLALHPERELRALASEGQPATPAPAAVASEARTSGGFDVANEAYNPIIENEFITPTGQAALSTFSIDVDTASYANVRRFLTHGQFPPPNAVRLEELLNYFRYDYPEPEGGAPFSVTTEIGVCPWNSDHRLARIGLKGREIPEDQRPPSNLVFLVDVSGSMRDANKLPLVQQGLEMLVGEMTEDDRVAIVTYAGDAGVKLPSTSGDKRDEILSVIRGLSAGGSTNGEAGIHLAYTEAIRHAISGGTNRVILCTDGDFNVGVSDDNELVRLIQDKARQSRVFLSIFGFGMGNLKDAKLEQLANKGNGQYAYVDNPREARKVFVEEMAGSLYTIAKDVKIQVEFNPARVGAYRLIGYENRALAARDFRDDTKDAGEIGAGHTVTALYELVPTDKLPPADGEPLKYQQPQANAVPAADASPESFTLKLRYKQPDADTSTEMDFPVLDGSDRSASPSRDFDWAASVAAFGLVLRDSQHKGQADLDLVRELALGARGPDASGHRREFIDLVYTARSLRARQLGEPVPAPEQLAPEAAEARAAVGGKYGQLAKKVNAPSDFQSYGAFNDFGYWAGTSYAGQSDLPKGYWVYVYPDWYIWTEQTGTPAP